MELMDFIIKQGDKVRYKQLKKINKYIFPRIFILDLKKYFNLFYIQKLLQQLSVHCHAGTGRTGLVIASYLMFYQNYTADAAIKQFRLSRKGGLSKSKQVNFLVNFEKCKKKNENF